MSGLAELLATSDATALAALVRAGEVSERELTEASIEVIERLNPELNAAIMPLFDCAIDAASAGLAAGPFRGVPTLLKDLRAAIEDVPFYMGTELLKRHDYRAPATSHYTDKLTAAGFNILGKTNTPELGILPTTEPHSYGPTRNPHDHSRSTGGSSGASPRDSKRKLRSYNQTA